MKYEKINNRQEILKRFTESDSEERKWIGIWNQWGTIHRLYVKEMPDTVKQKRQRPVNDPYLLEQEILQKSEEFIKEYSDFLKVDKESLVYEGIRYEGGIISCKFDQYFKDVRVYEAGVRFRFDNSGNLLMVGGDTFPDIDIEPFPNITSDKAVEMAKADLGLPEEIVRAGEVRLFVLPVPDEDSIRYFLTFEVPLYVDSPYGSRVTFIDAYSGEVIISYVINRYGISGNVTGLILPKRYNDTPQRVAFSNMKLHLLNQTNPINEFDLTEDPGWDREGMWEFGTPVPQDVDDYGHAGCPDPDKGVTGSKVFGYNLAGDYTNLMRPKYLTTDMIYCQNKTGVVLAFWRWLGVQREYWESDSGDFEFYDRATVEVSNDSGQTWTVIWSNGTSQIEDGIYNSFNNRWEGWNLQFFNISDIADGHDLVVRWGMGSTDDSGTFCGWNIDDIGLYESLETLTDPNGYFEFDNTEDVAQNMLLSQLAGIYVNVTNEDGASAINYMGGIDGNIQDPVNFDWYLDYSPLRAFDEFNVFYHMNLLLDYIKEVDPFYDAMDKRDPINVVVRYGDNYKNAFWSPENKICFGEGDSRPDGYRNFTLFSDIIYHEYTHAITDSFYSFLMPAVTSIRKTTDGEQTGPVFVTEFDAMHEAFSDYWAATMNGDPYIGDGDFWIKHKYVRNLDNKFKYPDDYGDDAYANSLILSGAMWETHELLGKDVADALFHYARYGGATDYDDFLIDVLLQDEITFGGEHVSILKDIFGLRGISRPPISPNGLLGEAGDTYIDLKWKSPLDEEEVAGFYVYFRTENDIASDKEDPSVRRDAGKTNSYHLNGLTNGTTYVLKVTAYNIYNAESEDSELVYATPYSGSSDSSLGAERRVFCFIDALVE